MIYTKTYLLTFLLVANQSPPSEFHSYKPISEYWGDDLSMVISNAFVVKFHDSEQISKSKMSEFESNFNAKITERIGLDWHIGIFESDTTGSSTTDRIREIQNKSESLVHFIEPLFALKLSFEPNDPLYVGNTNDIEHNPGQWYLKNTGNILPNSIFGADSKVWQAWELTKGDANTVISILDTGIDLDSQGNLRHPDLSDNNRIKKGRNYILSNHVGLHFTSDSLNVFDGPSNNTHGTWMAGLSSASENDVGIVGSAPLSTLLVMKVLTDGGNEIAGTYAHASILKSIIYLVSQKKLDNRNYIVSMSLGWGTEQFSPTGSYLLRDAIEYAESNGILIIASAGNTNNTSTQFPARLSSEYSNVISVNATDHRDEIIPLGAKANTENEITISSPGSQCSFGYLATYYCMLTTSPLHQSSINQIHTNTDSYRFTGLTSAATALTAGIASLVWSVHPNLDPGQIKQLLTISADKVNGMGGQNYHNRYGYGRINALKAVYRAQRIRVEEEMVSYKSLDETATPTNQGRRIAHDGSSSHIVYESGGEIVYFKRLSNGTLSTPILLSQLQDTLIGRNGKPSITLSGSTVHVVWQKKRYGYDVFDIVHRYSTNGGTSWSNEVYVKESLDQTWDPIPALAGSVVSWSPQLMLTYRGGNGIHALVYNFSTNLFGPYTSGNSLVLADTLATSPALAASYYGSNNKQHIAWSDDGDAILYSMFTASGGTWSTPVNLSSIVSGSADHLTPSISGNINGNIHVVWHRSTGSGQYQNIIYHRRKHSSDGTWPNQYSATYYQYQGTPSIKSVNSTEAMLAWSQLVPSTHCTYKQPYNWMGQWGNVTQLACGGARYPSVSLHGENRAVWTTGTSMPSEIVVSSSALKDQVPKVPTYIRSISWKSNHSSERIELQLASPILVVDGIEHSLPWVQVHPDTIISNLNLGNYLRPDVSAVDVETLSKGNIRFRAHILAQKPKDLEWIDVNVFNNGQAVHTYSLDLNDDKSSKSLIFNLPLGSVKKEDSVHIRPTTDSMFDLALGHYMLEPDGWDRWIGTESNNIHEIADYQVESPTKFSIVAYPNPFNPTTQIRFALPESGVTNLKIYDVIGRQVAVIVNGLLAAGEHQFSFDATGLPSGVYLYKIESGGQAISGKMMLVK